MLEGAPGDMLDCRARGCGMIAEASRRTHNKRGKR